MFTKIKSAYSAIRYPRTQLVYIVLTFWLLFRWDKFNYYHKRLTEGMGWRSAYCAAIAHNKIILYLIVVLLIFSCNNSENRDTKRDVPVLTANYKYSEGEIVYLKPDSLKVVISKAGVDLWDDISYDVKYYNAEGQPVKTTVRESEIYDNR